MLEDADPGGTDFPVKGQGVDNVAFVGHVQLPSRIILRCVKPFKKCEHHSERAKLFREKNVYSPAPRCWQAWPMAEQFRGCTCTEKPRAAVWRPWARGAREIPTRIKSGCVPKTSPQRGFRLSRATPEAGDTRRGGRRRGPARRLRGPQWSSGNLGQEAAGASNVGTDGRALLGTHSPPGGEQGLGVECQDGGQAPHPCLFTRSVRVRARNVTHEQMHVSSLA